MKKLLLMMSVFIFSLSGPAKNREVVQEEMEVKLVEIDVKVTTLSGKPITGLTPKDLVIRENGVVQTIDSFEEVRIETMPADQAENYRPRIMFILDLQNTSYANMSRIIPQMRRFADDLYLTNSDVGLSVNADGIHLVQPFTQSQTALNKALDTVENMYSKSYLRTVDPSNSFNFERDRSLPVEAPNFGRLGRSELNRSYVRNQLKVLGQFVHYLGAYDGNKSIILISDGFGVADDLGTGEVGNKDNVLSLKDIQTAGLYNKIAINVISLRRNYGNADHQDSAPSNFGQNFQSQLAAVTAGFAYSPNHQNVAQMAKRIVDDSEKFYRVRYYSKSKSERFRRVRVSARGVGRIAHSLGGYFPKAQERVADVQSNLNVGQNNSYELAMETDWMYWQWRGVKRSNAFYAIGQRAFNAEGQLVYEAVTPGSLTRKGRKDKQPIQVKLGFQQAAAKGAVHFEVTVIDLFSGKRVVLKGDRNGNLI